MSNTRSTVRIVGVSQKNEKLSFQPRQTPISIDENFTVRFRVQIVSFSSWKIWQIVFLQDQSSTCGEKLRSKFVPKLQQKKSNLYVVHWKLPKTNDRRIERWFMHPDQSNQRHGSSQCSVHRLSQQVSLFRSVDKRIRNLIFFQYW